MTKQNNVITEAEEFIFIYGSIDSDFPLKAVELVDKLIAYAEQLEQPWISVEDRGIEITDETVLILTTDGIVEAWFDVDAFEWVCLGGKFTLNPNEVTHLMPVPQRPKE